MRLGMIGVFNRRLIEVDKDGIIVSQIGLAAFKKDAITIENNAVDASHRQHRVR